MFHNITLADKEIYLEVDELCSGDNDNPPAYRFHIKTVIYGARVGACSFRVGEPTNRHIRYGGNIGYDIDEPYRGKKYSLKACKLLLTLAKLHEMKSVFITCEPENKASRRICEMLGAKFVTILYLPENDYNYIKHGIKRHCVYELQVCKSAQ